VENLLTASLRSRLHLRLVIIKLQGALARALWHRWCHSRLHLYGGRNQRLEDFLNQAQIFLQCQDVALESLASLDRCTFTKKQ
jgi:hypothetical protein